MKKSYKILLYALPPLVVATLLACAAFPPFLIVSVALLVIYYIILTKVLKLIPADEQETAQHEQQGTYYMPPTVQQPAAPQPVQQAVVPPAPPVAEPPAAQQPEADREKSVAEQPAAVPPEPVAKAESIPPAAQKEMEPVAQCVNPRYADEAEHTDPELENIPNISVHIDTEPVTVTLPVVEMSDPEPDSADDDDEPEEKGFYRRGSRLRKFPEEFVVIDFETTGFSPIQNEIIEVGMLKVCGTDVVDSYQQLVRPNKPVSARITKITGITNEMLKEAPAASDIMPDVLDFIGDLPLVGHNVSFDVGFLVRNANLYCDGNAAFPSFDTMQCAKRELPFLPDYKLGTVANYFDCQDETAHRALADCHSTLGCFICLMNYNE